MKDNQTRLTVLIVEHSNLFSANLRSALSRTNYIDQVSHAGNFSEAILLYNQLNPDIILLDLKFAQSDEIRTFAEILNYTSGKIILRPNQKTAYFKNQFCVPGTENAFQTFIENEHLADILQKVNFK